MRGHRKAWSRGEGGTQDAVPMEQEGPEHPQRFRGTVCWSTGFCWKPGSSSSWEALLPGSAGLPHFILLTSLEEEEEEEILVYEWKHPPPAKPLTLLPMETQSLDSCTALPSLFLCPELAKHWSPSPASCVSSAPSPCEGVPNASEHPQTRAPASTPRAGFAPYDRAFLFLPLPSAPLL